jgi:hypothetical protein
MPPPRAPAPRSQRGGKPALGGSLEPLTGDRKVEAMLGISKQQPPPPPGPPGRK